jgi:hypothetical protein
MVRYIVKKCFLVSRQSSKLQNYIPKATLCFRLWVQRRQEDRQPISWDPG